MPTCLGSTCGPQKRSHTWAATSAVSEWTSPAPLVLLSLVASLTQPQFRHLTTYTLLDRTTTKMYSCWQIQEFTGLSDHTAVVIHAIWIHITHHRMMYKHRVTRRHQALWNHRVLRRWQHQHRLDLSESN